MRNLRKAIAWILILMMLLSMAACGKKEEPAAPETTLPAETEPLTEAPTEAPTEVPTVMAKPLYGEILDSYFDALLQGFEPAQYVEKGLNPLPGMVKDVTKVGYCLEDLDNDGSTELLIGAVGEPFIYAMYTMKNDQETLVIDAGERNTYRISSDGVFVNNASNSAAQMAYFLYTFSGGELHFQDGLVYDAGLDSQNPWFYVKDTAFDSSTYEAIATADAEAITSELDNNARPIAFMPFSDYNS